MERRKFIATAAAAIPAIAIGQKLSAKESRTNKGFVVKATESRFDEKTLLFGNSPNDIKVSQKETNGDLAIYEYTVHEKRRLLLHVHTHQDEIFFIGQGQYLF